MVRVRVEGAPMEARRSLAAALHLVRVRVRVRVRG